jgi:hypothetical protein
MLVLELAKAIVNEQQPEGVTLSGLLEGVPVGWGKQGGKRSVGAMLASQGI